MVQYLLNLTAIWLLSLLMFDIFLKRESYHGFNRFYLLFTLVLGAAFPLIQWSATDSIYAASTQVERIAVVKQSIVSAAGAGADSFDIAQWLWYAYLAGVAVSALLIIIEVIKLASLYNKGSKHREGAVLVVETGKAHTPFSLLNRVYVCSKEQYTQEEWNIIMAHEIQHGLSLHIIDVLLLQLAQVIFWFHPLLYVYKKRLLMVHEYQADNISKKEAAVYGHFLVEQAMLQGAPSFTHSLNRSPIKNRILMLTKRSSAAARSKMLVFIPLLAVCAVCFAQNKTSYKKEKKGNIVKFKGNTFELPKARPNDTVYVQDPVSGQQEMKVMSIVQHPITINGEKIYSIENEVTKAPEIIGAKTLREYVGERTDKAFAELPDGKYMLWANYIITDTKGDIAYYELDPISPDSKNTVMADKALLKKVTQKVEDILNEVKVKPAEFNGKKVACITNSGDVFNLSFALIIKDHKARWVSPYRTP